jgi:hypothetical protein
VLTLLAEVARTREAAVTVEVTRAVVMLTAETAVWEAVAALDSAALRVKDAENRAALAEREALERVSRVEAESTAVLASAHEDAEGFVWKMTLLEDELEAEHHAREVFERERQARFEELTLLQT